jgi:hypothetical protein
MACRGTALLFTRTLRVLIRFISLCINVSVFIDLLCLYHHLICCSSLRHMSLALLHCSQFFICILSVWCPVDDESVCSHNVVDGRLLCVYSYVSCDLAHMRCFMLDSVDCSVSEV